MKVRSVSQRSAADIDSRVERVHKDIGYTGGKIDLRIVRDRLKLDLHYYQSDDPSLIKEVLHKLSMAGKQLLARPMLFFEAARKFDLSAFYLPDAKRILVDASTPKLKWRWSEAHEIGHSLLPWHAGYLFGDDKSCLTETCQQIVEAEANYGAGRLLFPNEEFEEFRRSTLLTHQHIRNAAEYFGNTITSTLWRCVERDSGIAFACIGEHPRRPRPDEPKIKYFVTSDGFERQFSQITEDQIWNWLSAYCSFATKGPLGVSEIVVVDVNGDPYIFAFESFCVKYYVHTIARCIRVAPSRILLSTSDSIPF
jgi:hypothetical protein